MLIFWPILSASAYKKSVYLQQYKTHHRFPPSKFIEKNLISTYVTAEVGNRRLCTFARRIRVITNFDEFWTSTVQGIKILFSCIFHLSVLFHVSPATIVQKSARKVYPRHYRSKYDSIYHQNTYNRLR